MSDLWLYVPEVCDGDFYCQDCDHCPNADASMEAQEEEEDDG